MRSSATHSAVVLVDPVSSGKHLKRYVAEAGHRLIAVFTLTDKQLEASGKDLQPDEKYRYCDHIIRSKDWDAVYHEIRDLGWPVAAVIAASEPGVELAEWLADRLNVIGNALPTSEQRRNKFAAREATQRAGLPTPDFAICRNVDEVRAFVLTHAFPLVVKTPKGAGSHQVFFCHSEEEATRAFNDITRSPDLFGNQPQDALIEEYIPGNHFVVELMGDGKQQHFAGLWQFHFGDARSGRVEFERARLITQAEELASHAEVIAFAKKAAQAVGIQFGPSLTEIRVHPERGPLMIEIGARLSGIELPTVVRRVSSFDPYAATLQVFLRGSTFQMPPVHFNEHVDFLFLKAKGSGIVERIEGMEAIQRLPSYFMSTLFVSPGSRVSAASDLATIPLYLYLCNSDADQLASDARQARELFSIRFRSVGAAREAENLAQSWTS